MPKRIYQLGEPCDKCRVPTVQGKFGPYCKPCYVQWAEAKKNGTPQYQAPVQQALPATCNCEETIAKIRIAFAELSKRVENIETYQLGQNKEAAQFHHSFTAKKMIEYAGIPVIDELPKGWTK